MARRASTTSVSALRSPGSASPRLDSGRDSAAAIASMTGSGVWVPPGPSKWAVPAARAGTWARSAARS